MPRVCSSCGSTTTATAHELCAACLLRLAALPEALGPAYEIETLLGSGAAGTSYLARGDAGALFVVKMIQAPDGGADPMAVADALRAALVAFYHPGVARTHAVEVDDDGNLRIVRDYVTGRPLMAWSEKADAALREQAAGAIETAVAAMHAHGLAHGHLAAENIVVAPGGRPVLVDLGAQLALYALQGAARTPEQMAEEDRAGLEALRAALMGRS
jgi:eukaryotic-like serine/threonine-protein kinase